MSGGIHCLVFSKDRAMQLDAFLRSVRRYAPYETMKVMWTASDRNHYDSYMNLGAHRVDWCYEEGGGAFRVWVRDWLKARDRVVFHTDDDVFYREAVISDEYAATMLGEAPLSYRLGLNTLHCHPLDRDQTPPPDTKWGLDCVWWRWRYADGDFGYPLSLNGTVYRSADLLPLLEGWHFANPTELEAGLACRAELFRPEWMTAPLHSCCVSLPHNRVSASSGCRTGSNPDWQPDALCEMFLDGWRIDLDAMDFSDVIGAHQEVPLAFTR